MRVTINSADEDMIYVYEDVIRCEETPTFLKLTKEGIIILISLQGIQKVKIEEVENESDMG